MGLVEQRYFAFVANVCHRLPQAEGGGAPLGGVRQQPVGCLGHGGGVPGPVLRGPVGALGNGEAVPPTAAVEAGGETHAGSFDSDPAEWATPFHHSCLKAWQETAGIFRETERKPTGLAHQLEGRDHRSQPRDFEPAELQPGAGGELLQAC